MRRPWGRIAGALAVGLLTAGQSMAAASDVPEVEAGAPAVGSPTPGLLTFSGEDGLWGMSPEDPASRRLLQPFGSCYRGDPFVAPRGGGDISPDGRQLAVVGRDCSEGLDAPYALWTLDIETGARVKVAQPVDLDHYQPSRPLWSPDGSTILLQTPYPYALHLFDLAPGRRTVVPDASAPSFATRTGRFAFVRGWSGSRTVYVGEVAGAEVRPVTPVTSHSTSQPTIAPDGTEVAQVCRDSVCVTDVASGATRVIAPASLPLGYEESYGDLQYSPDGRWIAAVRKLTGAPSQLHLIPTSGGQPVVVGTGGSWPRHLVWSPDSAALAFAAGSGGYDEIRVFTLATGETVASQPISEQVGWVDDGADIHRLSWQQCSGLRCPGPEELTVRCTVQGTPGEDTLVGTAGDDVICGGGGKDRIVPGGGRDVVRGGPGTDTLDLRRSPRAVTVDLGAGSATGWGTVRTLSVENVNGSDHDDLLVGDDGRNTLSGGGGEDGVKGAGGDDTVLGNGGDDRLAGGLGDDDLAGGPGQDRATYADSAGRVRLNLASGMAAGQGTDLLVGVEDVTGSGFDDFLVGSAGDNVVSAGEGIDTVESGGGADRVAGGSSKDYLYGGAGSDQLDGEGGRDYLDGGTGRDRCASAFVAKSC